jgi:hypothetical protein
VHLLQSFFPKAFSASPKEDQESHEDWLAWQRAMSEGWNVVAQSLLYVVQK